MSWREEVTKDTAADVADLKCGWFLGVFEGGEACVDCACTDGLCLVAVQRMAAKLDEYEKKGEE